MEDLRQDINTVSTFSRDLNGTFPWKKYRLSKPNE